jgi:hypothetical protein
MKPVRITALAVCLLASASLSADWREEASAEAQLANLVKLVPGTEHWMFEIGERYKNLYWAAKQENWEFAQYQVEEIEKLVEVVQLARPNRADTAQEFLETGIPAIQRGVEARKWESFQPAFVQLQHSCMTCHVKNDHGFITVPLQPKTAGSPVLNMGE